MRSRSHQRRRRQVLRISRPILGATRLPDTVFEHRDVLSESRFYVRRGHDPPAEVPKKAFA
jgi:hypothetical protein